MAENTESQAPQYLSFTIAGTDYGLPILKRDARAKGNTGNFFIDEDVLRAEGVADLGKYAVDPSQELMTDLFLE